ncbi:MAG: DNA-processing protein DprA, partial [Clostridia bacterium]|nr:DNA-processing protein DprA [Clostridia bacterium]
EVCAQKNIGILPYDSMLYPERLRRIQHPPAVLYYRGSLPDFKNHLTMAVVGTRGMTEDGRKNAYRIAYELSVAGAIIVSGMALGIDGTAQQAALDASGTSIAVLGSAIDICYPAEHLPLYKQLQVNGGILSEYAPGTEIKRWFFPQRNRIISGLCQGTLVAEAGHKSGALITAQTALSQGRDLFAIPGDPRDPARTGTNELIKNGAYPVTETKDILSHYAPLYTTLIPEKLTNPRYFLGYDDSLRYAKEKIEERRAARPADTEHPFRPQNPTPPAPRKAPEQKPIREERYEQTAEEILNSLFPTETPQTVPAPKPKEQVPEPIVASEPVETAIQPEPEKQPAKEEPPKEQSDTSSLTPEQRLILSKLRERKTFDEICACGVEVSSLMTNLTILELTGFIRAVPGGYYEII